MQCKFIKENSEACSANPMKDSEFCFLHNPAISDEEKKQIQSRGGKANLVKVEVPLPAVEIKSTEDVVRLLEDIVNRVRSGELDIRVANTLAYISGHLIKALELSEVEKRIGTIERVIFERSSK